MSAKKTLINDVVSLGETPSSTKETKLTNVENSMEELTDEALTACVGGNELLTIEVQAYGWPLGWPSDRNIKENFAAVEVQEVLTSVAKMPIQIWNYKDQNPAIRHIGPMAQDFAATFGVGESDQYINGVDANGVALAAIQALYKMLQEKDAQITLLRADLDGLKQQLINSNAKISVAMPVAA